MDFFNKDIAQLANDNSYFRQELKTGSHSQVVIMSIPPAGEIGEEVHDVDQILIFTAGTGDAILNGEKSSVVKNSLVFVPAGTTHNFVNTGAEDMKLISVYSPPEHKPGTVHKTKAEADAAHQE